MSQPRASVLIPTKAPGVSFGRVLNAVFGQETSDPFEVVIVDSGSPEADLALMRQFPVSLHQIPAADFGHGRTRNLLVERARGEILLFLTQDAEPVSARWMTNLMAPLADPAVAGVYARQIAPPGASAFAQFFLREMYGLNPIRRRASDDAPLTLDDMFFSNASSAIRREVWEQIPFRDVAMSEDQYWAHDALKAGYELCYQPGAQVYHSHEYTLARLFRRNWASGASLAGLISDSPAGIARRGWRYLTRESAFLVRKGQLHHVPFMLLYEIVRAAGFWLGMRLASPGRGATLDAGRPSELSGLQRL